ncbi:hypothetical protein NDU88_007174 [Pleurodeles waltl]|uniref:Uncharacterized protein n=1 Tax=Pleurodeles waltl TaxID=8319 RepID=A0AAV7NSC7_PLEWA|nr:hypothetical protein NDU88_007174 [Pleurodeles waltl]
MCTRRIRDASVLRAGLSHIGLQAGQQVGRCALEGRCLLPERALQRLSVRRPPASAGWEKCRRKCKFPTSLLLDVSA